MRERVIEEYLRNRVKAEGGRAYKFVSPGNTGVPDRIVLMPEGRIVFVELKAPGKKPTALQKLQHKRIQDLGFKVLVIDSKEKVDKLIGTNKTRAMKECILSPNEANGCPNGKGRICCKDCNNRCGHVCINLKNDNCAIHKYR